MCLTLADGVFDPLHAGHVDYLRACAAYGDPVIVQVSAQTKRAEFLPRVDRVAVIGALGYRPVTCESTAEALRIYRPTRYVKGLDWQRVGVPEQALCNEFGIRVCYVDTVVDSSTRRLQAWAARTAEDGLHDFETRAIAQQEAVQFDAAAQGYTYENRRAIEGDHPRILAELCRGKSVLDVGCGPGHFVEMLRSQGCAAVGTDPNLNRPDSMACVGMAAEEFRDKYYDAVVCREVLEHIPVREIGPFIGHLFRIARERVYITTRFTAAPRHPYDLTTEFDADPSHITLLPQPLIRALCVLHGGVRDPEWEAALDHQHKGRVLVYQVTR